MPQGGFVPYFVTMIEGVSQSAFYPSAKFRLHLRRETPVDWFDDDTDELHLPIQDLISKVEVTQALQAIAKNFNVQKMGLTSARRASPANTLLTVARRLDLCSRLAGSTGADLIGTHQRNLVVYLLLTCFDRLGQPAPYLPFESFLRSKKPKHKTLRDKALASGFRDYLKHHRTGHCS